MFRFDSFHMFGVIGSAVAIATVATWLIKRFQVRSFSGEPITLAPKDPTWTLYTLGGTIFGLGWALVGACPGPMLALAGTGAGGILLVSSARSAVPTSTACSAAACHTEL